MISCTTAALVLLGQTPVWVLMACGFAVGTAHSLAQPSGQALVANAVPVENLRSAVVLQSIAMNLARIGGPALAGFVILAWGAVESLAVYGALGVVAIVALRGVRTLAVAREARPRQGLVSRIGSGLRHARARPPAALALEIALIGVAGGLQFGIMTLCNNVIQQVVDDDHRAG